MAFELNLAAKRDPSEALEPDRRPANDVIVATFVASGHLDAAGVMTIRDAISGSHNGGAHSIVVEMHDVSVDEATLASLDRTLMTLRSAGVSVLVDAREKHLHGRLRGAPRSRDWLMSHRQEPPTGPRRAIHIDSSTERASE